ncbi:unnamed protein product [Meloidogyne enterolobii]|uniref:Uncharacterized protein n=2 Tax=Meloidogyne enterolobii TaxID=390850 RepID=A0A6V7W3Q6_MELEN|nr:unnamed protein product [Meloidogyne enterolobii]
MSALASTKNHSSAISSANRPRHPPPKPLPQSSSFVFGSSTPREISYINKTKVSPQDRLLIDTEPRRKKPLPPVGDKDIIYYMRQARSIGPRDRKKAASQNYAFGSSTPRSLSHLSKLAKEQRVYDAKFERIINKESHGMRSATNPNLVGNNKPIKAQKQQQQHQDDDDAASEPDIVQDRRADFLMTRSAFDMKNKKDEEKNDEEKKKQENEKVLENTLRNNLKLAEERTTPSPESE